MYLYIYTLTYTYIYSDFGAKEKQCIQIKAGNLLRDLTELFLTESVGFMGSKLKPPHPFLILQPKNGLPIGIDHVCSHD